MPVRPDFLIVLSLSRPVLYILNQKVFLVKSNCNSFWQVKRSLCETVLLINAKKKTSEFCVCTEKSKVYFAACFICNSNKWISRSATIVEIFLFATWLRKKHLDPWKLVWWDVISMIRCWRLIWLIIWLPVMVCPIVWPKVESTAPTFKSSDIFSLLEFPASVFSLKF